jgi:hypothetical protein
MSIPTKSEVYARLMEHLRLAQEDAAMLKHLSAAEGDAPGKVLAQGWFQVSEGLRKMQHVVTQIATGRMS